MSGFSGGCQCGAVRYTVEKFGKASICHCRMCQKAAGNYFMPLVDAEGVAWTRGERALFASSNLSNRGFCGQCGTPLTLETDGHIEIAIGSLDDPSAIEIAYHANENDRVAVTRMFNEIPSETPDRHEENSAWNAKIHSFQHPDTDTDAWPPEFWFSADHF